MNRQRLFELDEELHRLIEELEAASKELEASVERLSKKLSGLSVPDEIAESTPAGPAGEAEKPAPPTFNVYEPLLSAPSGYHWLKRKKNP